MGLRSRCSLRKGPPLASLASGGRAPRPYRMGAGASVCVLPPPVPPRIAGGASPARKGPSLRSARGVDARPLSCGCLGGRPGGLVPLGFLPGACFWGCFPCRARLLLLRPRGGSPAFPARFRAAPFSCCRSASCFCWAGASWPPAAGCPVPSVAGCAGVVAAGVSRSSAGAWAGCSRAGAAGLCCPGLLRSSGVAGASFPRPGCRAWFFGCGPRGGVCGPASLCLPSGVRSRSSGPPLLKKNGSAEN